MFAIFQRKSTTIFNNAENFLIKTTDNLPWVMPCGWLWFCGGLCVCYSKPIQAMSTEPCSMQFPHHKFVLRFRNGWSALPSGRTGRWALSYNLLDRIIYYIVIYIHIRDYHPHVSKAYHQNKGMKGLLSWECVQTFNTLLSVISLFSTLCRFVASVLNTWYNFRSELRWKSPYQNICVRSYVPMLTPNTALS